MNFNIQDLYRQKLLYEIIYNTNNIIFMCVLMYVNFKIVLLKFEI